ncbi:hypothetical protein [Humisphaera borealis]|uniref:Uncharacterized protein n=1 Tax=Humisphaera borealis TaxID=2807512 RepID=A0A7M2X1B6_9BACT|nr:hypothetical protein [Humisphaera borealis]QOV91493.1 hypothetical protein IPV69_09105 [Humisphaera borealis]
MAPNPPPDPVPPASAGGRFSDEPTASPNDSWKEAIASVIERIGEIREYASYYVAAQTDSIKTKATWIAIYIGLGVVAAVIAIAALATLGVLLISGIAGGLGELFGRAWLGHLVTAVGLLALFGIGTWVGLKVLRSSLKRKLMAKYEQRHQEQRRRYGSDVGQRAAEREHAQPDQA